MPTEVCTLSTPAELFQSAAEDFLILARESIHARGRFTVALSGGSTPKNLYSLLATLPNIPWDKILFFFGDERDVASDDPESNFRMANAALLSKAPIPQHNIFRVRTEMRDAEAAALDYEQTIQKVFGLQPGQLPRFDLIFLGMGPDGHTASLFPGTTALQENRRIFVANWVEKFHTHRLTLTLPVINHAACVTFLVVGQDKAPMVHQVLQEKNPSLPSAQVLPTDGRLLWLLDNAAAAGLHAA